MKTLHISAGGKSSRMRLAGECKHLLSIPGSSQSILGKIVEDARSYFENVIIWSGENTPELIQAFPDFVKRDECMTGPLGPIVRNLLSSNSRSYGCAGDFVCDFSWKEFENFHSRHGMPVSILVAPSIPVENGARFIMDGVRIAGWERCNTIEGDLINIGAYIIDPDDRVFRAIMQLCSDEKNPPHKEDQFFTAMIAHGMLAGYNPGTIGYNVNSPRVYSHLKEIQS